MSGASPRIFGREAMAAGSKVDLWRLFSRKAEENGILKLQYRVGRKGYVSLYWINYAIEGVP